MKFRFVTLALPLAALLCVPSSARAQSSDGWRVDFVPLYLWATSLEGDLSAGPATLPIDLDFADAAENLGGAFSFHLEAGKGRWAGFADLNFIRLESDADFQVGPATVQGDFELDNAIFEAGLAYVVHEPARLAILGGLRTYTLSPVINLSTGIGGATPVDASDTSANAFIGIALRPKLSEKWSLITRADIGGGDANLTWSAEGGMAFRFTDWGGLAFGYKALGIDIERDDAAVRAYDVVHHGPFFGLDFHFGARR
jgi:hypothetical protein